jgi:hypothetical protein
MCFPLLPKGGKDARGPGGYLGYLPFMYTVRVAKVMKVSRDRDEYAAVNLSQLSLEGGIPHAAVSVEP